MDSCQCIIQWRPTEVRACWDLNTRRLYVVAAEADSMQEPWKRCTFYTNKALGFATGAIFVRGTGQEDNVDEVSGSCFSLSVLGREDGDDGGVSGVFLPVCVK